MLSSHQQLDATYYISRVLIPPLERIFNLVGADVRQWYNEMPKTIQQEPVSPSKARAEEGTLDRLNINEHFRSTQCVVCGEYASEGEILFYLIILVLIGIQSCVMIVVFQPKRLRQTSVHAYNVLKNVSSIPTLFAPLAPVQVQVNQLHANRSIAPGFIQGKRQKGSWKKLL